jgi:flavin-dependent dehydrogenase
MGRNEQGALFDWETWQVRRSDFDQMMLDEAVRRGATLLSGKALRPLVNEGEVQGAAIQMRDGGVQQIRSEMLLDCSGMATWLANLGSVTGPKYLGAYDKQIAIFSQVRGARRDEGSTPGTHKDNTLIFYQKKYHWAWFIPIDDEVVSVGVVVPAAYFLEKKESKQAFLVRELHELHPDLKQRLPEIQLVEDVHVIPNYSYQVRKFCGPGFMCVGDAHRFVDPIFSLGLTVALREAQFAAPVIRAYLAGAHRDQPNPFAHYQLLCEQGIDVLEDAIDAFWEQPLAFGVCVADRYRELMTDVFAVRTYGNEQPVAVVNALRELLGRLEERLRSYESATTYSIPIGSRFHPERAALWQAQSAIETTESWMR